MKNKPYILIFILFFALIFLGVKNNSSATNYNSSNYKINDPVVTSGQPNSSSTNFKVGQSISQSVIGKASSTNFQLWSGFQYFFKANPNTLTSSSGNTEVNLSWSVPQTFLGAVIGNYELGVGTSSGNYVYENVGNVTNFTKTGLTNGTQYFFKIKSKTPGGTVLTFSNETSATPSNSTTQLTGNGGGSGAGSGKIIFKGFAYPNSEVFLLKDSSMVGSQKTSEDGSFEIYSNFYSSGDYNFSLYAKDGQNKKSVSLSFFQNLKNNEIKIIQNIIVPPTINLNYKEVQKNESINVFGFSQKLSKVYLYIEQGSQKFNFETTSNQNGFYNYNIETNNLEKNDYIIYGKSFFKNLYSQFSNSLDFKISDQTILFPETGGCPAKADFNNDCRVNLIDFSILAYWYLKNDFPKNLDLNSDNSVNLIDFSILAYNWTG